MSILALCICVWGANFHFDLTFERRNYMKFIKKIFEIRSPSEEVWGTPVTCDNCGKHAKLYKRYSWTFVKGSNTYTEFKYCASCIDELGADL